jgi:hypothetical protein
MKNETYSIIEDHVKIAPTETEVYKTVDEYFESINPNIMDQVECDKYGHYAKYSRDKTNFTGSYLKLSDITHKPNNEVYNELFKLLKDKGYLPEAYCPIVSDKEKKALDLMDKINLRRPSYRNGEYGRGILIRCNSGKTICFYFIPDELKGWWPPTFGILRFNTDIDSIYWSKTTSDDKLVIVFWNGNEIAHGNFEISYEGNDNNQYYTWEDANCGDASDSMSYTASLKIPIGDTDVEDIEVIHRN